MLDKLKKMKFRVEKVPGCLHGSKFIYKIDGSWDDEKVKALLSFFGDRAELTKISETGFFRLDIKGIGCLTGVLGSSEANLIINPAKPKVVLERKNEFEKALSLV